MRVLIGCSYSAHERDAFRALGHDAWSCDISEDCEGDPAFHIKADVLTILDRGWDFAIFHPTCTFMANSGSKHLYNGMRKENGRNEERWANLKLAAEFFARLWNAAIDAGIEQFVFENPIMHPEAKRIIGLGDQDQVVQPWWFGDPFFKATCHWRYGDVPDLVPTNKLVPPKPGTDEHKAWSAVHRAPPGPNRWKDRSRAFPGLVAAEASQWGGLLPGHSRDFNAEKQAITGTNPRSDQHETEELARSAVPGRFNGYRGQGHAITPGALEMED